MRILGNLNKENLITSQMLSKKTKGNILTRCNAEYSSVDKTLIVLTDKIGCYDSAKKYFINKDGSGKYCTAWGQQNFPKGTFDSVNLLTEKILSSNDSRRIDKEDSLLLLDAITSIIESQE